MRIATVELMVSKKYLIVGIRSKPVMDSWGTPLYPNLPEGLCQFSQEGCAKHHDWLQPLVSIRLECDASGSPDPMPLLTACDWLRDQGWMIEPIAMEWLDKALKAD